ncbi:type II secretion system minor pseudopilin GspJ [Biformimicrobium ophioploci]|uniref:Type II secretion system protein J n=1 Tax=Biformimicrobium ophioploci TaxID=3036711 RepID=A0ABQ6M1T0_9GAMM|nr:type II secretion system minor pseudopilin GspJ [Microbulbifer sp. NKW57]GMG88237.1 hypothetical protein MNKW57_25580 [Microbulbifer sp. NKW57]
MAASLAPRVIKKQAGFTLLELIVVVMIVAVIGIYASQFLDRFATANTVLEERADESRRLSLAFYRMTDDFSQVSARAIRDEYGFELPALQGDSDRVSFTRLGYSNFQGEPRGVLQRLDYGVDYDQEIGAVLKRVRWQSLDRGPDSAFQNENLLGGVDALRFRYMNANDVWLSQWPPLATGEEAKAGRYKLPKAVEVSLRLASFGEVVRVYHLAGGEQ